LEGRDGNEIFLRVSFLLQFSKEKDEGFFFVNVNDHSGTSCTAATLDAQSPRKKICLFVQKNPLSMG